MIYGGLSLAKGDNIAVLDSSSESILSYTIPRSMNGMVLFISTPDIKANGAYTISKGGTLSNSTESWNGWFDGGKWSGGTTIGHFTSSNVITTVGNTGMGGGMGGGGFPVVSGNNPEITGNKRQGDQTFIVIYI